jgi:hypothetical protein
MDLIVDNTGNALRPPFAVSQRDGNYRDCEICYLVVYVLNLAISVGELNNDILPYLSS